MILPGGNAHSQQQHEVDDELLLGDPLDGLDELGELLGELGELGELLGDELLDDPQQGQFG